MRFHVFVDRNSLNIYQSRKFLEISGREDSDTCYMQYTFSLSVVVIERVRADFYTAIS